LAIISKLDYAKGVGVTFYRFKNLESYSNLFHGVSRKDTHLPYLGSLALHTGEEKKQIVANRNLLADTLGLEEEWHFVVAHQTHSSHVVVIDAEKTQGWRELESAIEETDAMVTNLKCVMLTVLTADCVPILLFDPIHEVIGVVHAGWRGTKANIVAKTVGVMQERFGSNVEEIVVGIAPAIGVCCYEVGEEVATHFEGYDGAIITKGEKFHLDLPKINQTQLLEVGVKCEHIEMSGVCTACEVNTYFSYRKEQGCSGRFMSVIGLG
jgi:YfiH family protein